MKSKPAFLLLAVCLSLVFAKNASAFLPPSDTQEGVTLRIEGFKENTTPGNFSAAKISANAPVPFTVTLENSRDEKISGTVKVWLNDDWEIAGNDTAEFSVEAKKSAQAKFSASPKTSALNALYPIHAQMNFTVAGRAVSLHPIAIFEAENAPQKNNISQKAAGISGGILHLEKNTNRSVFFEQDGKITELAKNFLGSENDTGAVIYLGKITRGGVEKTAFSIHPPWRKGSGVIWQDFKMTLPKMTPVALNFSTAIRDSDVEKEGASDGVEFKVFVETSDKEMQNIFSRFSASKVWEPAEIDLSRFAGKEITLRIWTGPGPQNNTAFDHCYWGDLILRAGEKPEISSDEEWKNRDDATISKARIARQNRTENDTGAFQLNVRGEKFGAAVTLGKHGLADAVIAFSDGENELVHRGFNFEISGISVGAENGFAVSKVENFFDENGVWNIVHHIATDSGAIRARAKISTRDCALVIAWDMPDVVRDFRGNPRFTKLGIGTGNLPVWRAYAGFGNVVENPGAFVLNAGGFELSTRHVGADYKNGLSLLQACDVFPDRLFYAPERCHFSLETQNDAAFYFVPSNRGAFAAARAHADINGFQRGPGVDALGGKMCIDQWSGDYQKAAEGLKKLAKYNVTDAIFVKHDWQRWGYDYRLPEIFPPRGGLENFLEMRRAANDTGILFCPHDNYIDFYPDAAEFSYDSIIFNGDGTPQRAWYNEGRAALSYRWLPHAFKPWLEKNIALMRENFAADALFIDVFTAMAPMDYYDRNGTFHPRTRTVKEWRDAFDTAREILGNNAVMVSEAGTDALVGSVDAGQADHFSASRWMKNFGDAERVPWHDIVSHGKMTLFAGGLGGRYSQPDWNTAADPAHGYGSDDYLTNTVIGGRNPMCDGPFSRRTVMTYHLLHNVCAALAGATFESFEFGENIHQLHAKFSNGDKVWVNRGDEIWTPNMPLPKYGFYAETRAGSAGIISINGRRVAFSGGGKNFFFDARPKENSGEMCEFIASVRTNGAFHVFNGKNFHELTPLPESQPFDMEILAEKNIEKIELIEPFSNDAAVPTWTHEGNVLTIHFDAKSRAYRINFSDKKNDTAKSTPKNPVCALAATGAILENIADCFSFTEGPIADADGNVYFTDQPNNHIWKYDTVGTLSLFLDNAGRANGMFFDIAGNLIACADGNNELWEIDIATKKHRVLAASHDNKRFNGPNDVWVRRDGAIFFTDPMYARPYWKGVREPKIEQDTGTGQHVYFLSPDKKTLRRIASDLTQPNGIIGTADGKTLYIADIGAGKTYKYAIDTDGTLTDKKLFAPLGSDGMTLDDAGNLYLTGKGVTIFNPDGEKISHIDIKNGWTSNVTFGGKNHDELFITNEKNLWRLKMKTRGMQ